MCPARQQGRAEGNGAARPNRQNRGAPAPGRGLGPHHAEEAGRVGHRPQLCAEGGGAAVPGGARLGVARVLLGFRAGPAPKAGQQQGQIGPSRTARVPLPRAGRAWRMARAVSLVPPFRLRPKPQSGPPHACPRSAASRAQRATVFYSQAAGKCVHPDRPQPQRSASGLPRSARTDDLRFAHAPAPAAPRDRPGCRTGARCEELRTAAARRKSNKPQVSHVNPSHLLAPSSQASKQKARGAIAPFLRTRLRLGRARGMAGAASPVRPARPGARCQCRGRRPREVAQAAATRPGRGAGSGVALVPQADSAVHVTRGLPAA
jgi:hypothetical protein